MRIKLKICGMRDSVNISEVAGVRPDYMGFIFYKDSPRYVGENVEFPPISSSIQKVGVFVNEQTERIIRNVNDYQLDLVQLHGNETIDQCKKLKDAGIEIIKAFSVDEDFNFNVINPFKKYVRYFLFDTKGKYYGGNAKTFSWEILKKYDQELSFFLSGGVSPDNVNGIVDLKGMNIHAVDVNSGVEDSPGLKRIGKVKELKRVMDSW